MNPHLLPLLLGKKSLAGAVIAILRKYGTDAHLYLPGIGVINGFTAGNYLDSAGTTLATVDNPVGLVLDGNGTIDALQATTANKPILRKGAVNLLTYSEQFDNAYWNKINTTVTPNVINAPNGSLTADKLVESSTNTTHGFYQIAPVFSAGVTYTASIYAKAGERTWLWLTGANDGNLGAWFNLATGEVGTRQYLNLGATITPEGDGWYRCSITFAPIKASPYIGAYITLADVSMAAYLGDGVSGLYIIGAMANTGALADYVQTTTAPASNLVGGYHWVSDSTDLLTATYPAGYESATIVNALAAGQQTLTAQNIVGAYSIGPSVDTYGRMVFRTGLTASELAIIQQYANRLAGV